MRQRFDTIITHSYYSLILLIEFLVCEKKTVRLQDSEEVLNFYLQEKFKDGMNAYLLAFEQEGNRIDK
ncbi:hypothetical protein [Bacillus velezensis]|uniref:hypothetical protein n=1 Tax=Bacillus velezensis TaxID=492670 RepID=UPI0005E906BE|nr:hypothetical protein [Bacillus velezensis]MEC2018244.1 hypothetical protein [Bacillus velezensis]COC55667.1 Uncharacterised protein [Streptococcus pneumoniae]